MANCKSAIKRIRQNERNRKRNQSVKSRVKTYMSKVLAAIEAKDKEALATVLPQALSEIDRAASKGVLHKNNAARKKASLQRRAAKIA